MDAFKEWWHGINECHRVKVLGQEQSLFCEYFAGTYDLLISIDDKPYLIDFKTSNHVGYKYFMQLAAYRYLLYSQKNINVEGCIILQFDKQGNFIKEYNSIKEAASNVRISSTHLVSALKGRSKTAARYVWRYKYE